MNQDRLSAVRQQIDAIDGELVRLISERAALAQQVAEIKREAGEMDFYRPEREAAVLRRIRAQNPGPLEGDTLVHLFREIMSACLALEEPIAVAFLGPAGTFTQAATLKHFGHAVKTVPLEDIGDVFREVESGACRYGVVPVENSTEGVVNHTLDQFLISPLRITGEVSLRIHQYLLSRSSQLKAIQRLYSHQQSLSQCRAWLDRHLPDVPRLSVGSNAEAARLAAEDPKAGAIASGAAAEIYGLRILAERIEDEPLNTTRFLVIGREDARPSGQDKTSLLLSCRNEAGGLYQLLSPLAEHQINMTSIESRPSRRGIWEYVFFVDVLGHREDGPLGKALEALSKRASLFKILGSYPQAAL